MLYVHVAVRTAVMCLGVFGNCDSPVSVFVLPCVSKVTCLLICVRSFLLFQKLLEPFHPLSDLLGVVQTEEEVLWGQLW